MDNEELARPAIKASARAPIPRGLFILFLAVAGWFVVVGAGWLLVQAVNWPGTQPDFGEGVIGAGTHP